MARKKAELVAYPFVERMLQLIIFVRIFANSNVIMISEIRENGLTKGQISYASRVLNDLGVIERRHKRAWNVNFERAKQMMDSEVWIMD